MEIVQQSRHSRTPPKRSLRVLGPPDLGSTHELLGRNPLLDVFVAARVHRSQLSPNSLLGELWGYYEHDCLRSLCYSGANLAPVAAQPAAIRMFADLAIRRGRRCSSIVGETDAVLALWDVLADDWGPARQVRSCQPVMALSQTPRVAPDPHVRRVRVEEMDRFLPAAVAMFTEEVGVPPVDSPGSMYRARVGELVRSGRAFARFEDGEVVFKAEIGAVSQHACQIQGVWVAPERRGEGLSLGGLAAVAEYALADMAPAVSLYVNDFNVAARAAYYKVGFTEIGQFATVML